MEKKTTELLQIELSEEGQYSGLIDGIAGPKTTRAYEQFWASIPINQSVPIVTPAPVMPWWTSRGIWGALLVLAALPIQVVFGFTYDPIAATNMVMPLVDAVPDVMVAAGGVLAFFGRLRARAPVDPTLVARFGENSYRFGPRTFHHDVKNADNRNHFLGQ